MGAVFRAANLSATHHVRPFGFNDMTLHPVGVRIANLITDNDSDIASQTDSSTGADFSKRASLFRKYNRLGKKKTVQFSHIRDFTASLFHDSTKLLPRDIPVSHTNVTYVYIVYIYICVCYCLTAISLFCFCVLIVWPRDL